MIKTETEIQIRFADVDILGHVNNVNLQHYFDLGKTDYFRAALGMDAIWKDTGLITAATNTSYFAQTRMDERVRVVTQVAKIGTKSITLNQQLISSPEDELKAESTTVMVAFDFNGQVPVEVPVQWRQKLE